MNVSVVIPTLNGGELFRRVLDRVFSQQADFPFDVLCIDSGSSDGTPDYAATSGARVLPIDRRDFNHGLTRNLGIHETDGDFIALLVQDALPENQEWLRNLIQAVAEDELAAGGYARQIPTKDCDPIIRDRLRNWSASRPDRIVQAKPADRDFEELAPLEKLALIAFDNVSSCVRRSVWKQIPFPKSNFGEDVAWASKVIQAGYRILFEPESAVVHSHNNSVWYEFRRIYSDHQNLNRLTGLTTVPRFGMIFRNASGAFRHYRKLIAEAETSPGRRRLKTIRALPYAFLENLAQYLGAHLRRRVERGAFFTGILDRWLKKGV